jgi:hypothetical protein
MSLFKQQKNKRFNYKSRLKDLEAVEAKDELDLKLDEIRSNTKKNSTVANRLIVLALILSALLVLIYILEGYM